MTISQHLIRLPVVAITSIAFAALIARSPLATAGDWPQILGPARNGIAREERIVDKFAAQGPPVVWQHEVGQGFAGVAVENNRVIVFHRVGSEEVVEALEAASGKRLWKHAFPARYRGGISPDSGPRCVPLIQGDTVYLFGAAGALHAVALDDGKPRWSREAGREFGVPDSFFGVGSTPIVEGNKLLSNIGGKKGAGIVAFSLSDGSTIWQATDEQASYSSPVAVTVDGVRHLIFVTRLNTVSLDPENGKVRWSIPFGDRGPTVNAATPLVLDGHLFLSASYGIGAHFAKIEPARATRIWANNDTMSSQYSTCVEHQGFLYGVDGRADAGGARLRCFEPGSGKVRWSRDDFGVANLIAADGKLLIVCDDGTLVLAKSDPNKYLELGRARVLESTTRALPALSQGQLYVRDERVLKCVDVGRR